MADPGIGLHSSECAVLELERDWSRGAANWNQRPLAPIEIPMLQLISQWLRLSKRDAQRARRRAFLGVERLESREVLASLAWSAGPSLPLASSDAAAVVGSDGATYLLGGGSTQVQRLATGSSGWESGLSIDKNRIAPGAGLLPDGRLMLYGGINGAEAIEETFLYDFDFVDNQTDGPAMNAMRARMAYAADDWGSLYAMGGVDANGASVASAEVFDPYTETWTSIAPLPTARSEMPAISDGGYIFTFGGTVAGYGNGNVSSTVYRYDTRANTWQVMDPLPKALRGAAAAEYNGTIYVMGGISSTGPVADVYAYDILTNTWTRETDLPTPVSRASAVFAADGTVQLIGGVDAAGSPLTTVFHTQDLTAADAAPIFTSTPPSAATATAPYVYQAAAYGNPAPEFSLILAPDGMRIDVNGRVTWTPTAFQVGTHDVIVRANNRAGIDDQAFSITVAPAHPTITSIPITAAQTGKLYTYNITSTGFPAPTFTLLNGPAGMAVNAATGSVTWTPAPQDIGLHEVTIAAENASGRDEQAFSITVADTIAPTAPAVLKADLIGATNAILSWNSSTDNNVVAGYRIYKQYKYGWRNSRTGYQRVADSIIGTRQELTGLTPGTIYKYVVRAYDPAGNESPNSNLLTITALKGPSLYYLYGAINAPVTAYATHAIPTFNVYTNGVPTPTMSLVSGPAGLTFNPTTGAVNWTPTDAQVGTHTATFRATNSVGSANVKATFTVKANLPVVASSFTYFGRASASPFAVAGDLFELQLRDTFSGVPVTWSLVSGPAGMSVAAASGAVTWTPTADQVGTAAVTFRGTNYAGSTDLSIIFPVHPLGTDLRPPAPVTGTVVSNIDLYSANVTWTPTTDNVAVTSYEVTAYYQYVSRGTHTVTKKFTVGGDETSVHITGLVGSKNYKVYVRAFDESGNVSDVGGVISFTTTANPNYPHLSYQVNTPQVVAGQPMSIQLSNTNAAVPADFSLVSGPAGMKVDALTGLVTWMPSYADAGNVTMTFRASNSYGYRDVTLTLPVYFTGRVQSVAYVNTAGSGGTASWIGPEDMSHVAGYYVYQYWSINGHTYSRTYKVEDPLATSLSGMYLVSGPVSHSVTVAAYDALGHVGAPYYPRTPLA